MFSRKLSKLSHLHLRWRIKLHVRLRHESGMKPVRRDNPDHPFALRTPNYELSTTK